MASSEANGQIVSQQSGEWGDGTTWVGGSAPGPNDDVIISSGHTVTYTGDETVNDLLVEEDAVLRHNTGNNRLFTVNGDYIVNGYHRGPAHQGGGGTRGINLHGSNSIIAGTGEIPNKGRVQIQGNKIIPDSTDLIFSGANVILDQALTVTNYGEVTFKYEVSGNDPNVLWINESGSTLRASQNFIAYWGGELDASAPGNTVIFNSSNWQPITTPLQNEYSNLELRGSDQKQLQDSLMISGDIIIRSTLAFDGFNIGVQGNWDNRGYLTVNNEIIYFTGGHEQIVNGAGTQNFENLVIDKSGGSVSLEKNIRVNNSLDLIDGIVKTGNKKVIIGNSTNNIGAINVDQGYVVGYLERWINETNTNYLFPLGVEDVYRPATVSFNNLSEGSLVGKFHPETPGNNGLPLMDNGVEIFNAFVEGYWSLVTSNSLSSNNYDLKLLAEDFETFNINEATRLISRSDEESDWLPNGTHVNADQDTVMRDGLSTSPSQLSAQYTLGDTTDCNAPVTSSISGTKSLCSGSSNEIYSVSQTAGSTYNWEIEGGTIVSGQGTHEITVDWSSEGVSGAVSVVEFNDCSKGAEKSIDVDVHPVPFENIQGRKNIAAQSEGINYTVESRSNYSYSWSVEGGTIVDGSGSNQITVDWSGEGTGHVIVEASHNCGTTPPDTLEVQIFEVIESVQSGDWGEISTWDCDCVPQPSNAVRVRSPHNVTLTQISVPEDNWNPPNPGSIDIDPEITNLYIDEGATLDNDEYEFIVFGEYSLNGEHIGNEPTYHQGELINGTGSYSVTDGIYFEEQSKTILNGSDLTFFSDIEIDDNVTIENEGSVYIDGDLNGSGWNNAWVNENFSVLEVTGSIFPGGGDLTADNEGNIVRFSGGTNWNVRTPVGNTYYNLEIDGSGTKQIGDQLNILGDLVIEVNNTFSASGNNIEIGGNWYNEGQFNPGDNRVIFNGAGTQVVNNPETFHELRIAKSGSKILFENDVTVNNELIMDVGAIDVNGSLLTLGENAANPGTLQYSQGTILGAFQRWVTINNNNYLFPVGTVDYVREAEFTPTNITNDGTVTFEFIPQNPGDNGLPLVDGSQEVFKTFPEGYWAMSIDEGFDSGDYDLELGVSGLTSYDIDETNRLVTRDNPNENWRIEGDHIDATSNRVKRDNLFSRPANFAVADTNSCDPPQTSAISGADSICTNSSGIVYSVDDNEGSVFQWSIQGGSVSSGQGTNSVTVSWNSVAATGQVKAVENDGCLKGEPVTLVVKKHTIAPKEIDGPESVEEQSQGQTYSVENMEGYSFNWTVDGGNITSGQGTSSINVDWGSPGLGSVKVTASSSCGTSQSEEISVNIYGLIESIQSGNWTDTLTWDCNCIPAPTDNVKINDPENEPPHVVTLTDNRTINSVLINGDLNNNSNRITVNGNYQIFGEHFGIGNVNLRGNKTTIGGTGLINIDGYLNIQSFDKTISSSADLTTGNSTVFHIDGVGVTNRGKFLIQDTLSGQNNSSVWINAAGSSLIAEGSVFDNAGVLNASAQNNTVEYAGNSSQNIKQPASDTYFNLLVAGSDIKTLNANIIVKDQLNITSSLNADGNDIQVSGVWINDGTFNSNGNRVFFNGDTDQKIKGNADHTFDNLTINKQNGNFYSESSLSVVENLTMNAGNLLLNTDTLTIGTGAAEPGSVTHNNGYVKGVIGSWISSSQSDYFFPLGFNEQKRFGDLTLQIYTEGLLYFSFNDSDPGSQGLPLNDDGETLNFMFEEGYWMLSADEGLTISDYDIELVPGGFSTFPLSDETRVLTRTNSSSDWIADGNHVPGLSNNAGRTGITTFPAEIGLADTTSCAAPAIAAINGPDSVCVNDQNVTYTIDDPDPNSYYDWNVSGGTVSHGQGSDSVTINWSGQGGSIEVNQTNPCNYSASEIQEITIHPLPTSSIFGLTNAGENSEGVEYSVQNRSGYTYNWHIEGGSVAEGQGQNKVEIDWGSAGTGVVNVVGSTGCGDADTVSLNVNIYPDITSVQDGDWDDPDTWDCGCVPQSNDNVNVEHNVTLTQNHLINNLNIANPGVLDNDNYTISVYGNYTVDGSHTGNNRAELWGGLTNIDGGGTIEFNNDLRVLSQSKIISESADITHLNGNFYIDDALTVTNEGTYTLNSDLLAGSSNTTWINDTNAVFNIQGAIFPATKGILKANAPGNWIAYQSQSAQDIYVPEAYQYFNLQISGSGSKSLQDSIIILGDLLINEGTFDAESGPYNFAIKGDIENNASFSANGAVAYFNGNTEIKGSALTTLGGVHINDTLTGKESGQFEVENNWINEGTFLHNEGTVTMSGLQQNIDGATGFNNLTINSSSNTELLSDTSTIRSALLADGDLQTNGNLRLLSTENRTALIDGSGAGNVNGVVTMERYRTTSFGYTYLSSPFQNTIVENLAHFVDLGTDFPRFYRYHEPNSSSGWDIYTDSSNALYPGVGYAANLGADSQEVTISFSGEVNNGNVLHDSLTNSYQIFTQGFNLVGNPYPSPIDFSDSANYSTSGLDDALYFFDAGGTQSDQYGGIYASLVNGVSTGDASDTIAAMQGFFVRVSADDSTGTEQGSIEFTNAMRVNAFNPVFFKGNGGNNDNRPLINLGIQSVENEYAIMDELAVYFDEKEDRYFNNRYDAVKKMNTDKYAPNFYSFSEEKQKLSIQALPDEMDKAEIIPLGFSVNEKGTYQIELNKKQNLPYNLYFEDLERGKTKRVTRDFAYRFEAKEGADDQRFRLIFAPDGEFDYFPGSEKDDIFQAYSFRKNLFVRYEHPGDIPAKLKIFDINGRKVQEEKLTHNRDYRFYVPVPEGVYLIMAQYGNEQSSEKLYIGR